MKLVKDFFATSKFRGGFIFTIFIVLGIVTIIYNFCAYTKLKEVENFEYWSIFFFAVFLLFTWKFNRDNKSWLLFIKIGFTLFFFIVILLFITFPIVNVKLSARFYNGIGILIFMCAWLIEMYLFWISEKQKIDSKHQQESHNKSAYSKHAHLKNSKVAIRKSVSKRKA